MEAQAVVAALAALAHDTRLAIFRRLIKAGPDGVAAGRLAEEIGVPPPTLSFHLNQLASAGLVAARRVSRFVYYAADYQRMDRLLAYLTENCCGGHCDADPETARSTPNTEAAECCGPVVTIGAAAAPRGTNS